MTLSLAGPLRTALINAPSVTMHLFAPDAVETRRPINDGVEYPLIIVSPDVAVTDDDLLARDMPVVIRDIATYGEQPDDYRAVEAAAYAIRDLFHRKRWAITVPGFEVLDIVATGPIPAPVDDDTTVGRIVSLTVRLARL